MSRLSNLGIHIGCRLPVAIPSWDGLGWVMPVAFFSRLFFDFFVQFRPTFAIVKRWRSPTNPLTREVASTPKESDTSKVEPEGAHRGYQCQFWLRLV